MSILEQYTIELTESLKIDEMNVKDMAMKMPTIKHLWVTRLIQAKRELSKLEGQKEIAIDKISKQIQENSKVILSDIGAKRAAENHEICQKIYAAIDEQKIIIDYLEKVEKILGQTSYDISNIVKLIQLETL